MILASVVPANAMPAGLASASAVMVPANIESVSYTHLDVYKRQQELHF